MNEQTSGEVRFISLSEPCEHITRLEYLAAKLNLADSTEYWRLNEHLDECQSAS